MADTPRTPRGRGGQGTPGRATGGGNRDAAIRAGKRETWAWQPHEVTDLQRRVRNADGRAVFLWAWDDVCLAHTKRRAVAMEDGPGPEACRVTSVAENADESLVGFKSIIRNLLHGMPKGLKLAQLQSAFKDKTGEALDDILAHSLGFTGVDQMLCSIPDAARREGERFVGIRQATHHEITTLALVQNFNVREDVLYLMDNSGNISEMPKQTSAQARKKEARPVTLPLTHYLPYDDSVVYEDLTEMPKIHLPSLLHNIEQRFLVEKIYTYVGNMLIAVNPYKNLTMPIPTCREPCGLYEEETRAYYARLRGDTRQKGVRAHVFVVADSAYRDLSAERQNQSVVISGESGAGKTKSAREVLRYIIEVSSGVFHDPGARANLTGFGEQLVKKITQNNPVLEAFGNAKTVRNDNSSRFGKYLEIIFDAQGVRVTGAQIQTYLLEKSRLITQARGERSFHIFYQMLAGLAEDAAAKATLCLRAPTEYRYLGGAAGTFVAEDAYEGDLSEVEQWQLLQGAMQELGLQEDLLSILKVLSFVLLLGNLEFEDEEKSGTASARVRDASRTVLRDAAALVQCSGEALEEAITIKKEDQMFGRVPLNSSQAANNADALAKSLYSQLFHWLRDSINQELARTDAEGGGGAEGGGREQSGLPTIGLLDIFGFESFAVLDGKTKSWVSANSLEQLCINFANESLQMLFNNKVLEADRALYAAEFEAGDVPDIAADLRGAECLATIDVVLAKLWDSCREAERRDEYDKMAFEMLENFRAARREEFGRQSREAAAPADDKAWKAEERRYFPMPGTFIITHYADDVEYRADGMIEKNVDKCHLYLRTLAGAPVGGGAGGGGGTGGEAAARHALREPLCLLLLRRGLGLEDDGRELEEESGSSASRAGARLRTVAGVFKKQLLGTDMEGAGGKAKRMGLIPTLEKTHMHFVRCLKPNDYKRAMLLERSKVAGQLSSNGVVKAVKLAQAGGLPTRYNYEELWDRKGMDLGVVLRALWRRAGRAAGGSLPAAREGIRELLEGLAAFEWVSEGAVLSRPEDWQPLKEGRGSYKFGRTMLFLAAGRLGQLQLLRSVEMSPFAALLQAAVRRCLFVERYKMMNAKVREMRAVVKLQRWRRRWVLAQRRMKIAEAAARKRRQAELAAAAEAERQRKKAEEEAEAERKRLEEERRLREAAEAAAEEERRKLELEQRRLELERQRIAEEKRLEEERLAREEEERRNRWPPDGFQLLDVHLVRSRLADSAAPPGAPCGFGLQISSEFPFEIEGMAPGGAAAVSGKVAVGDKLVAVDGTTLMGRGIGEVRARMGGREGSAALLGLLRKEGVMPPPPDVNVAHPYARRAAVRTMIHSVAEDDVADQCVVTLKAAHGLLEGMYVRIVLGGVSQTEPLQGVHRVAHVRGERSLVVEGAVPAGLDGKDLTPDLFSYPSYVVRVPAPFLLPPRPAAAHAMEPGRSLRVGVGVGGGGGELRREEALGLEEFKPYSTGLIAVHEPRDIPEPLRNLNRSTQEFWLRHAPRRALEDLYYGAFLWSDFVCALRKEAAGGEGASALFGRFDLSNESCVARLREALDKHCADGKLPVDEQGQAVVSPKAFAALVLEASAAAPASLPADERERFPPWLVCFVPPIPEGDDAPIGVPQQLLEFVQPHAGQEGVGLQLRPHATGLQEAEAVARARAVSRVVAVMGSRGAGKSFLCRYLVQESISASLKAQALTVANGTEQEQDQSMLPKLAPKRPGNLVRDTGEACTRGVMSYLARLQAGGGAGGDGGKGGKGGMLSAGGGYRLPVRVLDTEGESRTALVEVQGATRAAEDVDSKLEQQQQRSDAVLVGIPRIAYLTCDVLVLVTNESLFSSRFYARLLAWAQVASGGTCLGLGPKAPALLVVANMMHGVLEDAELDVAVSTRAFLRRHERGDASFKPSNLLGGANANKNPQQPRLAAFFRDVSALIIPVLRDPSHVPPPAPASDARAQQAVRQLSTLQTEVYRLAAASHGVVGGGGCTGGVGMTEREWCALWRCAVPLWNDPHVTIPDLRKHLESERVRQAGGAEGDRSLEVARQAMQVFDWANMLGDARRYNPCPGHLPPKRALHMLHPAAADIAVGTLAVLCRRAEAAGKEVQAPVALRSLLQHIGGALPCAAADPYPQSKAFDRDQAACSKCRKEYEWAPFNHHRPITKERSGAGEDVRREAARRVLGCSSLLGQVQLYTEVDTQPVTGASLAILQVVLCTNVTSSPSAESSAARELRAAEAEGAQGSSGGGQPGLAQQTPHHKLICEITTDRPHAYQAGYLLEVSIKGIDPRNRLQAQPTRVLTVTGPTTFTLQGNVPRKISGVPLPSLLGRSKVWRVNGSFVSDVNWEEMMSSLRTAFAHKMEALSKVEGEEGFGNHLSLLLQSAAAAHQQILSSSTPLYDAPGEVARLRFEGMCKALGLDGVSVSASRTSL